MIITLWVGHVIHKKFREHKMPVFRQIDSVRLDALEAKPEMQVPILLGESFAENESQKK